MTSDDFGPFLTYLPTLKSDVICGCSLMCLKLKICIFFFCHCIAANKLENKNHLHTAIHTMDLSTATFFETGPYADPTKSRNPTILGSGDPTSTK